MNLRRHPPERRRRTVTLAAHGCCCCCCCCLHAVGGLIGSALASAKGRSEEERRTVKTYWLLFLGSVVIGIAGMAMKENLGVALVLAALGLPLAQLNASFLTLCAGMMWALDLKMLGRITWKGFIWAAVGTIVMVVPFMLLGYFN